MQATELLNSLFKFLRTYNGPIDYQQGYQVVDYFLTNFFDYQLNGKENVPEAGPLIVCSNHTSFMDMLQVAHAVYPHQVSFLAKPEFFEYESIIEKKMRGLGLMNLVGYTAKKAGKIITEQCLEWGMLRIDRKKKSTDQLKDIVKQSPNKNLGIFPEGTRTRTGKLGKFYGFCALVMKRTGSPIVPIGIKGTYKLWPGALYKKRSIEVNIGEPLRASDYENKGEILESLEGRIRELVS